MAIKGVSKFDTEDFFLIEDKDNKPEDRTIFIIGAIDVETRAQLKDRTLVNEFHGNGNMRVLNQSNEVALGWVRAGLRGWRNFKYADGNDIPFETVDRMISGVLVKHISDKTLGAIPDYAMKQIADRLATVNTATEELGKK